MTAQQIADCLATEAAMRGAEGPLSVLVVRLDWDGADSRKDQSAHGSRGSGRRSLRRSVASSSSRSSIWGGSSHGSSMLGSFYGSFYEPRPQRPEM